jgi:hypothetical protein
MVCSGIVGYPKQAGPVRHELNEQQHQPRPALLGSGSMRLSCSTAVSGMCITAVRAAPCRHCCLQSSPILTPELAWAADTTLGSLACYHACLLLC